MRNHLIITHGKAFVKGYLPFLWGFARIFFRPAPHVKIRAKNRSKIP